MTVAAPSRRLAGIAVGAVPAAPGRALPRMDVAAFVGFAASGPIDVPVAVEDPQRFEAIFGADLALAWDGERGERIHAQLAPAVRAFFDNGGRRAWVVRVAGTLAQLARLPVPGLVAGGPDGALRHAALPARSRGSWAGALTVGAALESAHATLVSAAVDCLELVVDAGPARLGVGDLLRIRGDGHELLVFVRELAPAAGAGANVLRVAGEPATALWTATLDVPPGAAGPARYVDGAGHERVAPCIVAGASDAARLAIDLRVAAAQAPPAGALVHVRDLLPGASSPALWLSVQATGEGADGAVRVTGRPTWSLRERPDPLPALPAGALVERLSLELLVCTGERRPVALDGLGFAPGHPRQLGDLPADEALFGSPDVAAGARPQLWAAAADPRFPLAGADAPTVFYPLGIGPLARTFLGPLHAAGSALERDGLERFDDALFLDSDLRGARGQALAGAADFIRWQRPAPRRLRAMHALLEVEEATIVAVPDAAHRRWASVPDELPTPPPLAGDEDQPARPAGDFDDCGRRALTPAPRLAVEPRDQSGGFVVSWTAVHEPGVRYVLQESTDPQSWEGARAILDGPQRAIRLSGRTRGTFAYRVRAEADANVSAWSNGVVVAAPRASDHVLEAEDAFEPHVLLAVQRALLRLCAARGDMLAVLSLPEHLGAEAAIAHAERLRAPVDADAPPRADDLVAVPPLGADEQRALGFGALYRPWLVLSGPEPGAARRAVPDGSAVAIIARRAATRGAWSAPATERFANVVALVRAASPDALGALRDAQVNEIRHLPQVVACLGADTLLRDPDLRSIGVRRLLSLLRRLALLEGSRHVFEPGDPVLRRAIERGFEQVMQRLHTLGAFAGRRPEDAFRVNVGDPPIGAGSIDAGRLVVELMIAPSRPLAFLRVRLVHTGDGDLRPETP